MKSDTSVVNNSIIEGAQSVHSTISTDFNTALMHTQAVSNVENKIVSKVDKFFKTIDMTKHDTEKKKFIRLILDSLHSVFSDVMMEVLEDPYDNMIRSIISSVKIKHTVKKRGILDNRKNWTNLDDQEAKRRTVALVKQCLEFSLAMKRSTVPERHFEYTEYADKMVQDIENDDLTRNELLNEPINETKVKFQKGELNKILNALSNNKLGIMFTDNDHMHEISEHLNPYACRLLLIAVDNEVGKDLKQLIKTLMCISIKKRHQSTYAKKFGFKSFSKAADEMYTIFLFKILLSTVQHDEGDGITKYLNVLKDHIRNHLVQHLNVDDVKKVGTRVAIPNRKSHEIYARDGVRHIRKNMAKSIMHGNSVSIQGEDD